MSSAAAQLREFRAASPPRVLTTSYGAVDLEAAESHGVAHAELRFLYATSWCKFYKPQLLAAFLVVALLCVFISPQRYIVALVEALEALPPLLSSVILATLIILACVFPLPVSLLQIATGY